MKQYYKVAKTDGFDFYTGKTINYRKNIGRTVKVPSKSKTKEICSSDVIHASRNLFDAIGYGELPCSIFVVEGNPVTEQSDKCGFKRFKVIKEINTEDWKQAYYKIMVYILEDVKNNFDNKKYDYVTEAINKTILVFKNAQETGKINESTAWSAESTAESAAEYAAESTAEYAARSALSAAEYAARSAEYAARSAESTARSAEYAARSAEYAARSAESTAEYAALSAEYAAGSAKYTKYSEKFVEFLSEK